MGSDEEKQGHARPDRGQTGLLETGEGHKVTDVILFRRTHEMWYEFVMTISSLVTREIVKVEKSFLIQRLPFPEE